MKTNKKIKYTVRWLLCLITTIIIIAIMMFDDDYSVAGISQLNLAQTDQSFLDAMTEYNLSEDWLEGFIYRNFALIIAYTALFYYSLKLLMQFGKISKISFLGLLCLIPGAFNVAQNLLMLQIINHGELGEYYSWYTSAVWIKWLTLIPFIILVILVLRLQVLRLLPKKTVENK